MEEGIVPGGGIALVRAADAELKAANEDQKAGIRIALKTMVTDAPEGRKATPAAPNYDFD